MPSLSTFVPLPRGSPLPTHQQWLEPAKCYVMLTCSSPSFLSTFIIKPSPFYWCYVDLPLSQFLFLILLHGIGSSVQTNMAQEKIHEWKISWNLMINCQAWEQQLLKSLPWGSSRNPTWTRCQFSESTSSKPKNSQRATDPRQKKIVVGQLIQDRDSKDLASRC